MIGVLSKYAVAVPINGKTPADIEGLKEALRTLGAKLSRIC